MTVETEIIYGVQEIRTSAPFIVNNCMFSVFYLAKIKMAIS